MPDYHVLKIGGAYVGGSLGADTALAVGSVFYDNHSIVSDAFAGEFDEQRAASLIRRADQLNDRYGVQMALDVLASSPEAMERFLEFTASHSRLPLFINSTEVEARLSGLEAAARMGLLDRVVFASLSEDTLDQELEWLGRHRPAGVMILAADITDTTPEGACRMIENTFQPMLREIGVTAPLVDVGTMDPPSIGLNMRQIEAVRRTFGYPAGCAFANCFPQWKGLAQLGREWVNLSLAAALAACRGAGADFLHYGIIEKAHVAAHAAATAEVFYGFAAKELDRAKSARRTPPLENVQADTGRILMVAVKRFGDNLSKGSCRPSPVNPARHSTGPFNRSVRCCAV